jgi:undecaprenol kinase/diacylglycerol kinase (ATP)
VVVAEIFNTALEVLVDLVSPGHHPKAGIVKDLSSAAVLITAILSAVIGLCIFLPKLISYAS